MKRLCFLATVLTVLFLVGCAGTAGTPGESDSMSSPGESAFSTEAYVTEPQVSDISDSTAPDPDVTTAESAPEDTESAAETEPLFIPTTYEEHLAEIYRKTDGRVQLGGFLTPTQAEYTETALRNAREAGLTFMVTQNEFYGTVLLANTLRVADEMGMDINVWTFGPHVFDTASTIAKLRQCLDHPCVKYLYLYDEPVLESMPGLKEVRNSIIRNYGSTVTWKLGGNMYSYPALDQPNQHPWSQTAESFLESVQADYISFDLYPWENGGGTLAAFITNLAMEKELCDKYGAEMWTYLQTAGFGQCDLPSEGQLRYQANVALAMGADALLCYTATEHSVAYTSILHSDGTPSGMFENAKAVFNDIHAMHGVFLPYTCEGLIIRGQDNIQSEMKRKQVDSLLLPDQAWGSMASVDGTNLIISCMRKEDGTTGLYIVNGDYTRDQTVTVHLDGQHTYQLWNRKGLEIMGTADTLTLELIPGDGCFVALDVSLDATTYPEPVVVPTPEAPKVVDVEKDSLIFDLGFDENGQAFNKADSDVYLRSFSGGTVKTVDDKQVLTKYSIYTCDIKNAATNGVTVEMYIKLTKNANSAKLALFSDLWGNGNLYRICDAASDKSGIHYFHGSYDGNDVMLKDDIETLLPIDTWLHIVSVTSDAGQYVYVNGKLISEGHFAHTPMDFGSFVFSDHTRGVAYLSEARVYTYAATQAQVAEMYAHVK